MFRAPPIPVRTLEYASYNNVESLGAQFVEFSLTRWLTLCESAISQQMLGPSARQRFHADTLFTLYCVALPLSVPSSTRS
jgi:hypothetical protein